MQIAAATNLMDIDLLVEDFLQRHQSGLYTIHRTYFKDDNQLSLKSMIEHLKDQLRTGCVTFLNKNHPMKEIDNYLFYITHASCKGLAKLSEKKQTEYICPGCLFFGTITLVSAYDKTTLGCDECRAQLKNTTDPKKTKFFKAFAIHSKRGYRCPDCQRFIPIPLDGSSTVFCPYFDCCFIGEADSLNKMNHITSNTSPEHLILDMTADGERSFKDSIPSSEKDAQQSLEQKESLLAKIKVIQEVIFSQHSHISYSSSDFTIKHKQFVYQAFDKLLKQYPQEMVGYLLDGTRSGGFQHKVFQEYIRLLEQSIPFLIRKRKKTYTIDSLLSKHLCIFDGISVFKGIVTDKLVIKNGTTEMYIGGRKASYTKPYYIGKLIGVINSQTKEPLLSSVKEYTFSRIYLRDVAPGTLVTVTHLRVPPHYQMGGMVYVNRVRKKIIERACTVLEKENYELSSF
jgi:hypothetical protein